MKVLTEVKIPAIKIEIEKYIRHLKKTPKGLIHYQKLL